MKKPKLPDHPIDFEGLKERQWCRVVGFRCPRKGEWYLSGAAVEAYKVHNALGDPYFVVEPIPQQKPPILHETKWAD